MSQKRKGVLTLQGKCVDSPELIVVESSPEIKRKKSLKGASNIKNTKTQKKGYQPMKKKPPWVSPSFDSFNDCPPTSELSERKSDRRSRSLWEEKYVGESNSKTFTEGDMLWCDKYSPTSESDLAVHKKKVAEVRDWLLAHLCSQTDNGILLLTGPPGAGKTATLQVLAKEIGIEIQEWINPLNPVQNDFVEFDCRRYEDTVRPESQLKLFRDFFLRANKYPCLSFGEANQNQAKQIILVEEMPNLFYRSAGELHELLRYYRKRSRNPVVFIVSDSNSNCTNAYRLFPKDVTQKLGIFTISFNPASVTSLNRVVNKIVSTEAQKSGLRFQAPSKEVIDSLVSGSNGDIRGMINNLQFTCLRGCLSSFQKQNHLKRIRSTKANKSKSSKSSNRTPCENEGPSISAIGGKDTSLFLFRVLGKILYCKREENDARTTISLPAHLKRHERRPLLENPENVFEKSHMSGENLTLYLHQNYMDFFDSIDDVSVACEYLSDADHLTAEWTQRSTLSCYTPSLAIRGLMFCNKGRSSTQGKSSWRPLHKPQWYTVFKQTRNNILTAMDLFPGHCRNAKQLQCEIIPYLALTDVPLRSPSQITYLQTVCKFSRNMLTLRESCSTLQEKEIDDEETEIRFSQAHVTPSRPPEKKENLVQSVQVEEENDIEEFEDDYSSLI